jgi:hypothetical protein
VIRWYSLNLAIFPVPTATSRVCRYAVLMLKFWVDAMRSLLRPTFSVEGVCRPATICVDETSLAWMSCRCLTPKCFSAVGLGIVSSCGLGIAEPLL